MGGMKIVAKQTYLSACEAYPAAAGFLKAWYDDALAATWSSPQDVKNRYPGASIIANNRVVFNIRHNEYRLIVGVSYRLHAVYIKFFGTHREYDRVDAATVEQRRK